METALKEVNDSSSSIPHHTRSQTDSLGSGFENLDVGASTSADSVCDSNTSLHYPADAAVSKPGNLGALPTLDSTIIDKQIHPQKHHTAKKNAVSSGTAPKSRGNLTPPRSHSGRDTLNQMSKSAKIRPPMNNSNGTMSPTLAGRPIVATMQPASASQRVGAGVLQSAATLKPINMYGAMGENSTQPTNSDSIGRNSLFQAQMHQEVMQGNPQHKRHPTNEFDPLGPSNQNVTTMNQHTKTAPVIGVTATTHPAMETSSLLDIEPTPAAAIPSSSSTRQQEASMSTGNPQPGLQQQPMVFPPQHQQYAGMRKL